VKKGYWLVTGLTLVMTLALWNRVSATGPPEDNPDQDGARQVGLTSTTVDCLVVKAGTLDSASVAVHLEWEGQIEEAFLMLAAAGSEGGHSIYVNSQLVGSAPFRPGGQLCQAGSSVPTFISTDMIPIPTEVLVKGENVITLTNDANVNDGWTAANLYLEINGVLSLPLATPAEDTSPVPSGIRAAAVTTDSVTLTSSYDGISHEVWYQVPMSYTGSISVPLVVAAHGMGTTGEDMVNGPLAAEANARGWLLVAPQMHGAYYLDGQRALAWPGAQHDIIEAIEHMQANYEVNPSRLYITGGSMGGQTTAVMAAKYPDVFAAAVEWKGITDLADWYNNEVADDWGRHIIEKETGGTPEEVPFEYQRRSAMAMPQNSRLVPLKIWHDEEDQVVEPYHSYDLMYAINSWDPPIPVTLITVTTGLGHGYNPDPVEVFDFLEGFVLSPQPPLSLTIRTDESKPYYWLNVAQTGGDHWSAVEAAYSLANKTVTATISDTQPLTVALNLGSTPIIGRANISQPGMGLPATTYLVKGGGSYTLANYTSGYLTTTLSTTGPFTLTISAITVEVSANPSIISATRTATSTITAVVRDHLSKPVPNDTTIAFSTTEGTFPNASSTYTAPAAGGQATTTLTLDSDANLAEVVASVGSVTGSTSVDIIYLASVYLPVIIKSN
jgi:acetyl esterase/lipase